MPESWALREFHKSAFQGYAPRIRMAGGPDRQVPPLIPPPASRGGSYACESDKAGQGVLVALMPVRSGAERARCGSIGTDARAAN